MSRLLNELTFISVFFTFSEYCVGRKNGLYTYTADYNCYIHCDEYHRTFIQPCAYGSFWVPDGYEPAQYNRCVGFKKDEYFYGPNAAYKRGAAPQPKPFTVEREYVKSDTYSHGSSEHAPVTITKKTVHKAATSYGAKGEVHSDEHVRQYVNVDH